MGDVVEERKTDARKAIKEGRAMKLFLNRKVRFENLKARDGISKPALPAETREEAQARRAAADVGEGSSKEEKSKALRAEREKRYENAENKAERDAHARRVLRISKLVLAARNVKSEDAPDIDRIFPREEGNKKRKTTRSSMTRMREEVNGLLRIAEIMPRSGMGSVTGPNSSNFKNDDVKDGRRGREHDENALAEQTADATAPLPTIAYLSTSAPCAPSRSTSLVSYEPPTTTATHLHHLGQQLVCCTHPLAATAAAPTNGAEPGAGVRTTLAPKILFSRPVLGEPVSAHVASYLRGDEERSDRRREQEAVLEQLLAQAEPDPSRFLCGRMYAWRSGLVLAQEVHAIEEKESGIASATRGLYSSTRLKYTVSPKRDGPSFPSIQSSEASAAATVAFAIPYIRRFILAYHAEIIYERERLARQRQSRRRRSKQQELIGKEIRTLFPHRWLLPIDGATLSARAAAVTIFQVMDDAARLWEERNESAFPYTLASFSYHDVAQDDMGRARWKEGVLMVEHGEGILVALSAIAPTHNLPSLLERVYFEFYDTELQELGRVHWQDGNAEGENPVTNAFFKSLTAYKGGENAAGERFMVMDTKGSFNRSSRGYNREVFHLSWSD